MRSENLEGQVNLIERSVKRYTKVASLNVQFSRKHFWAHQ